MRQLHLVCDETTFLNREQTERCSLFDLRLKTERGFRIIKLSVDALSMPICLQQSASTLPIY